MRIVRLACWLVVLAPAAACAQQYADSLYADGAYAEGGYVDPAVASNAYASDAYTDDEFLYGDPETLVSEEAGAVWTPTVGTGNVLPRVGMQYHSADGIGYEHALLSLDGFLPLYQDPGIQLTFADLRLLVHDGRVGFNAGVAHRVFVDAIDSSVGASLYYDNFDTGNRTVGQVSGGLDVLGSLTESRLNWYLPLDDDRRIVSEPLLTSELVGNRLLTNRMLVSETPLAGFDVETGTELFEFLGLWGFVGGYHFQGEFPEQAWGVRGRVEMRLQDKGSVGLSVSNDTVFDTNVILSVAFRLPGYRPDDGRFQDLGRDKLGYPVIKQQNVVVATGQEIEVAAPLDPLTGRPFNVVHAGAPATVSGTGTMEDPLPTVSAAVAAAGNNDIIYIHGGVEGQPAPVYEASTIRLKPGQRLVGGGSDFGLYTAGMEGEVDPAANPVAVAEGTPRPVVGSTYVPATAETAPILRGTEGNAVELADYSQVTGIRFEDPTGSAIFGENVDNVGLGNFTVRGGKHGVELINVGGSINVAAATVEDTHREGILIRTGVKDANVAITDVLVEDANFGEKGHAGLSLYGDGALHAQLVRTEVVGSKRDGLFAFFGGAANGSLLVSEGQFTRNEDAGIAVATGDLAHTELSVLTNDLGGNGIGVSVFANASAASAGEGLPTPGVGMNLQKNQIVENERAGVQLHGDGLATLEGNVTENTIARNKSDGVRVQVSGDSTALLTIDGNGIGDNSTGINIVADGSADSLASIDVATNDLRDNRVHGLAALNNGASRLELLVEGNTVEGNDADGIHLVTNEQGVFDGRIESNTFVGNTRGLFVHDAPTFGTDSYYRVYNNLFETQTDDAMAVLADGSARAVVHAAGNTFRNNQGVGLRAEAVDISRLWLEAHDNLFTANGREGMHVTANGTATMGPAHELRLLAHDNTFLSAMAPGLFAQTLGDGRLYTQLQTNDSDRGFVVQNNGLPSSYNWLAAQDNQGSLQRSGDIIQSPVSESFFPGR